MTTSQNLEKALTAQPFSETKRKHPLKHMPACTAERTDFCQKSLCIRQKAFLLNQSDTDARGFFCLQTTRFF